MRLLAPFGALTVVLVAACGGSGSATTVAEATGVVGAIEVEATANPSAVPEPAVAAFCASVDDRMRQAGGVIDDLSVVLTDYSAGNASSSETADAFRRAADGIEEVLETIDALGDPPGPMAQSVELVGLGLDRYVEAYRVASDAYEAEDVALLSRSEALLEEGGALFIDAANAKPDACN